jgi:hypothetical protein
MYYFAYGSNMSSRRLGARVPAATRLGTATLYAHCLKFHKRSRKDNSAKCDVSPSRDPAQRVLGVLYELPATQKAELDRVEGLGEGYAVKQVQLELVDGRRVLAYTYYATLIDPNLKPYHWYKQHVLRGAQENGLARAYIEAIAAEESVADPDAQRHARELAIYADRLPPG